MSSDTPSIAFMNYTINKFMGCEKVAVAYSGSEEETEWQRNNEDWMDKVGITQVGDYAVNVKDNKWYRWEDVKYHTSWDWLIPVIKKIKGMHLDILKQSYVLDYMHAAAQMNSGLISLDIVKAHAGVYKFLQWYNQNKNQ